MKKAFTLAEVLITLGIIGIVAAMTLPTLINNSRNKELKTGLLKSYSILNQALDMYQAETGERLKPGDAANWEEMRDIFILKYFKIIKNCGRGYLNGSCVLNNGWGQEGNSETYKTLTGNTISLHEFDDGQYVLPDGTLMLLEYSISTASGDLCVSEFYISFDVNGFNKRPNKLGVDLFTFQIDRKGKLLPMGAEGTTFYSANDDYCSKSSGNNLNGIGCTYKALTDKDYFKNLPK